MDSGNKEGDVVLVYYREKPSVYARIEGITQDVKNGWYRLRLLFLTIPPGEVTWILREEYINGAHFTMGGQPVRLEKLAPPKPSEEADAAGNPDNDIKPGEKASKVIPFKFKKP